MPYSFQNTWVHNFVVFWTPYLNRWRNFAFRSEMMNKSLPNTVQRRQNVFVSVQKWARFHTLGIENSRGQVMNLSISSRYQVTHATSHFEHSKQFRGLPLYWMIIAFGIISVSMTTFVFLCSMSSLKESIQKLKHEIVLIHYSANYNRNNFPNTITHTLINILL